MAHTVSRRAATFAAAWALVLGGVALATPAFAASFGGYITSCGSGLVVTAQGTKVASGGITLTAPNRSFTDTSGSAGVFTLRGTAQGGSWGVTGSGATAGSGFCS